MLTPKGQIEREGSVNFGDASISIWEEGIPREWKAAKEWELVFKRQVFARIVQTLNRLGWTCEIPQDYIKQYSKSFARNYRICHKGDLKGWLETSGRTIKFEMWQDVTPSENRNGGRYDFDKEKRMPYVIRLEMERSRRRIRDYLCNVFKGYTFDSKERPHNPKPLTITAMDRVIGKRDEDWLPKPDSYHSTSADGQKLQNGQRVFYYDYHGRMGTGTAYCDGGMWDVVTGKWDYERKCNSELYVRCPGDPRVKRNQRQRRKRLEDLMAKAIKAMDFKRAEVLKGILWPVQEPLYLIKKGDVYFRPDYSGYTSDTVQAGKYTADELKPYASDIERGDLKAIPMAAL